MDCECRILGPVAGLRGVVSVRVPGIYGWRGDPLPSRMSRLVSSAAEALQRVFEDVRREGGHLYLSDMFRSATAQQQAHEDWKAGRKTAYSPPSCGSVHEAARAVDIDAFDTGIGHARVREILVGRGWTPIVETLTGPECWHYEFRERRWEEFRERHGYAPMAHAMKEEIGNRVGFDEAEKRRRQARWIQEALNVLLGLTLEPTGLYDEALREAVCGFQRREGLQVDGVAGPITRRRIAEQLEARGVDLPPPPERRRGSRHRSRAR